MIVDPSQHQSERLPLVDNLRQTAPDRPTPCGWGCGLPPRASPTRSAPQGCSRGSMGATGTQVNAPPAIFQIPLGPFAGVDAIVVCCQVQLPVAAPCPSELLEQVREQLVVLALSRYPMKAARPEVQCPGDPHLAIPGVGSRLCASSRNPLWGWSPAWSRPGRTIQLCPPSKGHLRASPAFALADLLNLCGVGPDAAFSSESPCDGACSLAFTDPYIP